MYVNGVSGGPTAQDPGPKSGASSLPPTWNKGAMSKRFDGKDEATKTPSVSPSLPDEIPTYTSPVNCHAIPHEVVVHCERRRESCRRGHVPSPNSKLGGNPGKDVTVGVAPCGLCRCSRLLSNEHCFFPPPIFLSRACISYFPSAQRVYTNPRGTGFTRGGAKPHPHAHHQPEKPLPPSYVCYRCGQKGSFLYTFCLPTLTFHKAIGYKTAQPITIGNLTTGLASSGQQVSLEACSRQ